MGAESLGEISTHYNLGEGSVALLNALRRQEKEGEWRFIVSGKACLKAKLTAGEFEAVAKCFLPHVMGQCGGKVGVHTGGEGAFDIQVGLASHVRSL